MTSRSYYEFVEREKRPDAVAYDLVIFEDPNAIDVIEHDTPPAELARLMAQTYMERKR
jgi:hypothetical protein